MEKVSVPPLPTPLEELGNRPFSFYPAIVNIEHNQWLFRRATWSEVLVYNTKSEQELWVPRRFLGEVSRIDDPVVIVGLIKELEYKAGGLWPYERRVLQMPRAVNEGPRPVASAGSPPPAPAPAPVVGIRLDNGAESRIGKMLLGAIAVGIAACVLVVTLFRHGPASQISYSTVLQTELPLSSRDDIYSVKSKMGEPAEVNWRDDVGELQYQKMWYPSQKLNIILMGTDRKSAHYIGALDDSWHVVHSVDLPGGMNSANMLRSLKRF
jgi:hypothetical protein